MIGENDIIKVKNVNSYASNKAYLKTIVDTTFNTWQKDRDSFTKKSDTKLGKLAENIIEMYIKKNLSNVFYLSYDDFRNNNYKKHAPFDGIVVNKAVGGKVLKSFIDRINIEITKDKFGKISDKLKQELHNSGIFIVEIKSTRINPKRHYQNGEISYTQLLEDDFLEYPKYLRVDKFGTINNWNDYLNFCYRYREISRNCDLRCMKSIEESNMRHLYIRIYIDEGKNTAYIIGSIWKTAFIQTAVIKKMIKRDKSEYALYLASNLRNGNNINELNNIQIIGKKYE